MLVKPIIYDGGLQRQVFPGDTVAGGESILATQSATTLTITAAMLLNAAILRNPAVGATDTIDTAANLVAGLMSGLGLTGISNGTTFRTRIIVTTAQTDTVQATANTGVTVNRGAIAASSMKEFLVTVVNGTPAQSFLCTTVSGSAVVGGLTAAQCALLSVGMVVTNAVANLQATTIIAVNGAAGTVTMSGNANATNTTPVTVSFSPVVVVDGLAT